MPSCRFFFDTALILSIDEMYVSGISIILTHCSHSGAALDSCIIFNFFFCLKIKQMNNACLQYVLIPKK